MGADKLHITIRRRLNLHDWKLWADGLHTSICKSEPHYWTLTSLREIMWTIHD